MDIDANINIEIDDDDIVEAVEYKLEKLVSRLIKDEFGNVDSAVESWIDNNPLHDYIDWDSAYRSGQMTFNHTDDEVRSLIREVIKLNPEVLRPILAEQIEAALAYRVPPIVRAEMNKWVQSLGNLFANMTHDNNKENDSE